ncbi:MAG: hypothetical protein ABSE62_13415 [Chthoniobacteraceae bacterium]|jgi:hypothetical protein
MQLAKLPRAAALALLCAVVLLTRLPFLSAGYGLHADNWRTALAARHIAQTGVYEASRFPGYPIQEYICSLFWKTGPLGFNLLDALFCTLAVLFFALICIDYGVPDWWLAALAFAFVPVLYVNSVSSKDFPWALAFLLASWWCALRKRPVLTGILLGLAMGVRITSGVAALPIALILIDGAGNRAAIRRVLVTGLLAAIIVVAAFTPVYIRYGTDFFNFYAEHAFPGPLEITARMTLEVWGLLGVAGLSLALIAIPFAKSRPPLSSRQLLAWISMVVIYAIAFFCLPDEAAYLIPAVPFILLLIWLAAPRWAFRACCALILISPFVSLSGIRPTAGLIIQDHRDRVVTDSNIRHFLQFAAMVSGSNAYICGSWEPPIDVLTAGAPPPNTKFLYLVTQPELDKLTFHGWRVWYLPNMREFNYRVYQYDIAQHGARNVRLLRPDRAPAGS